MRGETYDEMITIIIFQSIKYTPLAITTAVLTTDKHAPILSTKVVCEYTSIHIIIIKTVYFL